MRKLLLITALMALLVIPVGASADAPEVQINGQGTIGPINSEEVIGFTLTARSNGPLAGEYPAAGQIEIRTIEPGAFGHWSIHGAIVCIELLEGILVDDQNQPHDVWEVRYQMIRSDFPEAGESGEVGAYNSFYVEDDPGGDWAGELTGHSDFEQPECGPRGPIPVFSLLTGDIRVNTRP